MIRTLTDGIEASPRIKKFAVENYKLLKDKLKDAEFDELLNSTFAQQDEAKVKKIMELFTVKKVSAPPKKDFKAFLKQ